MIKTKKTYTSLTRISDLRESEYQIDPVDRSRWETGDYVVGEVTQTKRGNSIELANARLIEVSEGVRVST